MQGQYQHNVKGTSRTRNRAGHQQATVRTQSCIMPIQPQMTTVYIQAMSPTASTSSTMWMLLFHFSHTTALKTLTQGEVLESHQKISEVWPDRCRASSACLPQVSTSECRGTRTPQCDHQGWGITLSPTLSWHTKDPAGKDHTADQGPAICHDQASHRGRTRSHAVPCNASRCSIIHCSTQSLKGWIWIG